MYFNKKLVLSKNIKIRKNGQNVLVYNFKDDLFFELNSSAGVILDLIDGEKSITDIISILTKEYNGDEKTIKQDVKDLFRRLEKLKVVSFN